MTYIKTGIQQPGIIELLFYKNSTGNALSQLAQTLLLGKSPLSPGDREIITAYVSYLNECEFCHLSHKAAAEVHNNTAEKIIQALKENSDTPLLPQKLKALLQLAALVQRGGKNVTKQDVENASRYGATDEEIHDTILIAAAFCMFNRYVDGLGTQPAQTEEYREMGKRMAKGYKLPPDFLKKFFLRKMNKESSN
jgi:uncharacterized peroxidase-related enzyme